MARYTVLRLLVFFGVLCALWLTQLRGWALLVLSAVVSAIISTFLLAGPREAVAQKLEQKVTERRAKADEYRTAEDDDLDDDLSTAEGSDEADEEYTDR
ncbi:DUF4229 domain-containing protein [Calidifontibacter indicus]|uniref:Uncharacterized protein DUF4229 n=1 Tax=Calidifontibacter indicus TaxID=419650 RepID=A0A3D9UKW1_9MICO|nr:DUF4229 domain-containing protein [Calidifontibacter indicus]REF30098.1 uncharacterized protein DUF4229 [Calidifontibacter indicus]